jgi:ABC-type glycerol-3-phosphate transport system substrate-binding protein
MWSRILVLAAALTLAPSGARAADLVVWWQEGFYAEEDEALREVITAFEQDSGKQVELVFHPLEQLPDTIAATFDGGQPPDFAFGFWASDHIAEWALDDQLVDLSDTIGHFSDLFDPAQLDSATLLNATTGQKALYGLPIGQAPTSPTSGRATWNTPISLLRTSRAIGKRIGPSGATRSSPRYAKPQAATTSGAWGFRCQPKRPIPRMYSASL